MRADIRLADIRIKRNKSNVRSNLVEFDKPEELLEHVQEQIYRLEEELKGVNPITITINLGGGRKVKVQAEATIGIDLGNYRGATKRISAALSKDPKSGTILFGGEYHEYLCLARGVIKQNNIKTSELEVTGLTHEGMLTRVGMKVLSELESTPIEEVEEWVVVNLLSIRNHRTTERACTRDYLLTYNLIRGYFDSYSSPKYTLTQAGIEWLEGNIVRLRPVVNSYGGLVQTALQFYPLEALNEDLVHEHSWIRRAAQERLEELQNATSGNANL